MANDIHMRDSFAKNHGAVVLAGTENADVLTYPVPNEGFQQWASLDHYAQRVLAGRFHYSDVSIGLTASDRASAASGSCAVTYTAGPGITHEINGVEWGFVGAPTNGELRIEDAGVVVRSFPITEAGPDSVKFEPPVANALPNSSLVVRLYNVGAVSGVLNVEHQLA